MNTSFHRPVLTIIYGCLFTAILISLSACASVNLQNRIACTPGKDTGYFISMWQWLGIASTIDKQDSQFICSASIPAAGQNQPKGQRP